MHCLFNCEYFVIFFFNNEGNHTSADYKEILIQLSSKIVITTKAK